MNAQGEVTDSADSREGGRRGFCPTPNKNSCLFKFLFFSNHWTQLLSGARNTKEDLKITAWSPAS